MWGVRAHLVNGHEGWSNVETRVQVKSAKHVKTDFFLKSTITVSQLKTMASEGKQLMTSHIIGQNNLLDVLASLEHLYLKIKNNSSTYHKNVDLCVHLPAYTTLNAKEIQYFGSKGSANVFNKHIMTKPTGDNFLYVAFHTIGS